MVNNELILKFSNEKYYTKQEVQREMRIPSVDKIWEDILSYRSNFIKPLTLKHITGARLNVCLTPAINKKVNDFERKLNNLMLQYTKLKILNMNTYFEYNQQKIILNELSKYYHITSDDNIISSLVKKELSLIPPEYYIIANYLKCLNSIKDKTNEVISDLVLGEFYSNLMGTEELSEFYRIKEVVNEYNKVLIDKVYIGIPPRLIGESMDYLFEFIQNSDASLFVKAASTLYYIYYIHPFEFYSEEISILLFKKVFSYFGIDELATYINFEKILNIKEKLEFSLSTSQKNLDLTYFIEFLLNNLTPILDETLDNLVASKSKEIINEFYQVEKEEKVVESKKEPVIEDVFKNIEPYEEEVIKSDSTQNVPQYNSEIAIKNIPSGLKEEDAKRLEQHLLEMNPSLSRSQAFFYARHCTLGMSYTISQFKKEVGCAYETARTSMDNLVNLGYYRKEMLRNKFIYTPVKKY